MRRLVLLVVLASACDCGRTRLNGIQTAPKIVSSVAAISEDDLCAASDEALSLRDDGDAPLTISALAVTGAGFALVDAPPLPQVIAPHASLELRLHATDGDGVLDVKSDDPKTPDLAVPLHAHANVGPTVKFVAPEPGTVLQDSDDLVVSAKVSDDADAADSLKLDWSATTVGELSHLPAAADGSSSVHWSATGRPHGPQTLTLTATDHCGATTTATLPLCFDGTYSYEPFHLQGWHYEGSAAWDAANDWLLLTPATAYQAGSAFETSQVVGGDQVDIEFGFFVGNGTGADGFSLTALDSSRMTTFLGPQGCGMGYGGNAPCTTGPGLPGWSVEVDTYYNAEVDQTQSDHVAFTFDGNLTNQPLWKALPNIVDSQWHTMKVSVHAPHVHVEIDGTTYLDADAPGNYAFPAYVGFTAATGGETDEHRIKALNVTGRYCQDAGG